MKRPQPDEYSAFQKAYIDKVSDDPLQEIETQSITFPQFLRAIPEEKIDYAYAEGKWTLKEMLGHIIDTERILTYRLLRIARNDSTGLPGFEEDDYVKNSHFKDQDFGLMIEEFRTLRKANLFLYNSLNEEELQRKGLANGNPTSVRALLFIIAGHMQHHKLVIEERYL